MLEHDKRPWGEYWVLDEQPTHKVKRILVNPNQRLSYQYHNHREETWVITDGIATVTLNDETIKVHKGNTIFIPKLAKHRVANQTQDPLVFIEIQQGTSFDENDIIRIEDDYIRC